MAEHKPSKGQRPLHPVVRALLIAAGTVCTGLGLLGVFLPVLPSTPLFLVAAACYVRSSDRLYGWLVHNRHVGQHVHNLRAGSGLPLRVKVGALAIGWIILGGLALFMAEDVFMKALLVGLAIIKTVVLLRIKTLRSAPPFDRAGEPTQ